MKHHTETRASGLLENNGQNFSFGDDEGSTRSLQVPETLMLLQASLVLHVKHHISCLKECTDDN